MGVFYGYSELHSKTTSIRLVFNDDYDQNAVINNIKISDERKHPAEKGIYLRDDGHECILEYPLFYGP
jgi:hypothetical protein